MTTKEIIVKRFLIVCTAAAALVLCAPAEDKKLAMKDLPPAVQKTVEAETKGAEVKSISKEVEKGVTQFEVETMVNGKHRDFEVDVNGKLLVVEEEISIDAIPAAAKAAILKKVGDGKLELVETFKKGSETQYEISYTTKKGKKEEALFKADGTPGKE